MSDLIHSLQQQAYELEISKECIERRLAEIRVEISDELRMANSSSPYCRDSQAIEAKASWLIRTYAEGEPLSARVLSDEAGCSVSMAQNLKLTPELKKDVELTVMTICSSTKTSPENIGDVAGAVLGIAACSRFGELSGKMKSLQALVDSVNTIVKEARDYEVPQNLEDSLRSYCTNKLLWKSPHVELAILYQEHYYTHQGSTLKDKCDILGLEYGAMKMWLSRNRVGWKSALTKFGIPA